MVFFGLGNPGPEYKNTRHNIGFMVIDHIASQKNLFFKKENLCLMTSFSHRGQKIILAKPQTYMNLSGKAVNQVLNFYKIPSSHMIVIHDDIDLEFLSLKFQKNRGPGGHNGISHIHEVLKSSNYMRLKLGVGRSEENSQKVSDFVLESFSSDQEELLKKFIEKSVEGLYFLLNHNFSKTASLFNGKMKV